MGEKLTIWLRLCRCVALLNPSARRVQEAAMDGLMRGSAPWILAYVVLMCVGCASVPSRQEPASVTVPISDVHAVAGTWEGLLKETPPPPPLRYGGDWITLTIADNGEGGGDGIFEFATYRTIGVFSGSGPLNLANGTLHSESEQGRATYTLQEKDGTPILVVEAVDQKGVRYHAELTRAR